MELPIFSGSFHFINNNAKYNEYNNMENNNDNITSRQSLMYPSFDELNDE